MLILLTSIPVFYFSLEYVILKNVDENLLQQKEWFNAHQDINLKSVSDINSNVLIEEKSEYAKETLSTIDIYDKKEDEYVKNRVLNFFQNNQGKIYKISIRRSLVESEDILKTIAMLQMMLFLLMAFSLFFINKNVENNIWKPFYKMLENIKNFRIDQNSKIRFQESEISELNLLNHSISDLLHRNRKQFTAQKEFTENASHELQTPLSIIQNKLELLLQTENISEEQMKIVSEIYDTGNRLSRLNKSLLLLSKLDNGQYVERKNILLPELINKIIEDFKKILSDKDLEFKKEIISEKTVSADEDLMGILFGNLFSNACKYALPKSEIIAEINNNYFKISNTSAFSKLNENLLFKRFQKQNSETESNGLGLEICRKICEIYGWNLRYFYENDRHFFTIDFVAKQKS